MGAHANCHPSDSEAPLSCRGRSPTARGARAHRTRFKKGPALLDTVGKALAPGDIFVAAVHNFQKRCARLVILTTSDHRSKEQYIMLSVLDEMEGGVFYFICVGKGGSDSIMQLGVINLLVISCMLYKFELRIRGCGLKKFCKDMSESKRPPFIPPAKDRL